MRICIYLIAVAPFILGGSLDAQQSSAPAPNAPSRAGGSYASDIHVVIEAQDQALEQARQALQQGEGVRDRGALEAAIKEMERARSALDGAEKTPSKLDEALAAQQKAYQALLKVTPREYRVSRAQNGGGGGAGQPGQRELDQLDLQREENRYETERQASAAPNARQQQQLQTANRLRELARRQQDVNERLRELQAALQAAKTDSEREEIQRQLKRLRDQERQMLSDMDEMRQQLDRSEDPNSLAETRQRLDQTRSDMERAAQEMDRNSASQALAAGTRAQQNMRDLREDLRKQTSSEFSEQMRQMRTDARDLSRRQDELARQLDSIANSERKALVDDSSSRQQLLEQMAQQQSALTNLLTEMRSVTVRAENTEPLLSKQLYDALRRADQMHTDNLLDVSSQLASRGFFPQASEIERSARTNINNLRQSVERAAESVLGSEADELRFAQKELDDLARQIDREIASAGTNSTAAASGRRNSTTNQSNLSNNGQGRGQQPNRSGDSNTNSLSDLASRAANGGNTNSQTGDNSNAESDSMANSNSQTPGQNGEAGQNEPPRQSGQRGQNGQSGQLAQGQNRARNSDGQNGSGEDQLANNANSETENVGSPSESNPAQQGGSSGRGQRGGSNNGARGGDQLGRMLQQMAGPEGRGGGGPITGNGYADWADRLRDVQRVLDSDDLRNQLGSVADRVGAFRNEFRNYGRVPGTDIVQQQVIAPMTQVRVWLQEELARQENSATLVPLDRDPVPDNYSEVVRTYYENLGNAR